MLEKKTPKISFGVFMYELFFFKLKFDAQITIKNCA